MEIEEKIYLNALNLAFSPNIEKVWKILKKIPSPKKAFLSLKLKIDPEKEWQKLEKEKIKFITKDEKEYPPLLREIPNPPLGIYVKGEIKKDEKYLAVVGSRKASNYGKMALEEILPPLLDDFVVVSGFAKGIDALSHKISLSFKKRTIAVLGAGLDICYPKEHKKLFKEIEKNGALISEYPLGTKPFSFNFPLRNRIIAGISLGVLVVEAKEKSGSLITANFALDFGREIFAIPGSIFSQNTKGTHKLIKEGAKLVEKGEDILEAFDIKKAIIKEKEIKPKNEEEKKILDLLKESPLTFDEIFKKTKIEVSKLNSTLLLMEIEKKIKKSGNLYKINQ